MDKDNTLNRREFHSCATGVGVMLKEEEANALFDSLDTSGSGSIGIEEFVPFMVKQLTGALVRRRRRRRRRRAGGGNGTRRGVASRVVLLARRRCAEPGYSKGDVTTAFRDLARDTESIADARLHQWCARARVRCAKGHCRARVRARAQTHT